ncbi:MAG TPA: c-type cytochrome [Burkholderiales bacterium]|nr:c-type cytochrome [Burkholderiales bacterium]
MSLRLNRNAALAGAAFLASLVAASAPRDAGAQQAGRSGKEVVESVCAGCHATGKDGAPRIGDRKAWSQRAAQGITSLTDHALKGIRQMPPHGGNPGLSDLEIARAIAYMVNRSGGKWVEPASANELARERSGERVVREQCAKCHQTGEGGAPKIGDRQAWIPRLKLGLEHLTRSAIHGHGGMPPRGGEANLTDTELRSAILYMYDPAGATAPQPATGAAKKEPAPRPGSVKTAGGMEIHLGIVSAEALRAYPKGSPEAAMHGGVPRGAGYYHLNVSLFDAATGAPVTGARVEARVEEVGLSSTTKALEPVRLGNATSYGQYFRLGDRASHRITIKIQKPGAPKPVEVVFEHRSD